MANLEETYGPLLMQILSRPWNMRFIDIHDRERIVILPINKKLFNISEIINQDTADRFSEIWKRRALLPREKDKEYLSQIFGSIWLTIENWAKYKRLLFVSFQTESKYYEMLVDCGKEKVLVAYLTEKII